MSRTGRKVRSRQRPPRRWPAVLTIVILLTAAGWYLAVWKYPTYVADSYVELLPDNGGGTQPLPTPSYTTKLDGTRMAHLDNRRLTEWCRSVALPDPPALEEAEPAVAEGLLEALGQAALNRTAAALGRVGQICESLDAHRSAEEYFRMAAKADPRDHRWPYYMGCIAQVTGRTAEAVEHFSAAMRLNADYPVTYARLAQLYLDLERDDDAAAMAQRFTALRPQDWLGYVGMGRVALRRGDFQTALRYLGEAVQRGPKDFQAHYYLGKTYAALNQADKAKEHFEISATLPRGAWFHHRDPLDQELHRSVDSAAALQDQLEAAQGSEDWPRLANLTERILQRRPHDVTMLCNLASFYRKMQRYDDAHKMLGQAAAVSPGAALIHARWAEVYLAQGQAAEALRCVEEAHQRGPPEVATLSVKGRSLFLLRRYPEAEWVMRQAVEMVPDNAGNYYVLGEILRALGRTHEAVQCFRRVLELRPNDAPSQKRLAELEGAEPVKP